MQFLTKNRCFMNTRPKAGRKTIAIQAGLTEPSVSVFEFGGKTCFNVTVGKEEQLQFVFDAIEMQELASAACLSAHACIMDYGKDPAAENFILENAETGEVYEERIGTSYKTSPSNPDRKEGVE